MKPIDCRPIDVSRETSITPAMPSPWALAGTVEWWQPLRGPLLIQESLSSELFSSAVSQQILGLSAWRRSTTLVLCDFDSKVLQTPEACEQLAGAVYAFSLDRLVWIGREGEGPTFEEVAQACPRVAFQCYESLESAMETLRPELNRHDVVVFQRALPRPFDEVISLWNQGPVYSHYVINLSAVRYNLEALRSRLPQGTRVMAMMKARAYGTEDFHLVKFLVRHGVDIFGLAYADEAVALRQEGVSQDLFVLAATPSEVAKIVRWQLQVGVSDEHFVEALEAEACRQGVKVKVHLHVDTGMRRFGCRQEEALSLALKVSRSPSLVLEGIMTHLPSADDPEATAFTQAQYVRLQELLQDLRREGVSVPWVHGANSAASLDFSFPDCNMVRVGLALYGLDPAPQRARCHGLRNALSLFSQIVGLNELVEGEPVSYGGRYRASRSRERVAVVPLGYFDGIHRCYGNKGRVILRGREVPIVGSVCMDCFMVDVTDVPDAQIGDPVLVFGQGELGSLDAVQFAERGGTIAHELITCLGPRMARVFVIETEAPQGALAAQRKVADRRHD